MGIKRRLSQHYFPEAAVAGALRRRPKPSGVVLMYHEVLPDEVDEPVWTVVRESAFRWQMEYLATHFEPVTLDEGAARLASGFPGSKPFCVVTFDDGYRGTLTTALPILSELGLPCVQYVTTEAAVTGRPPWFDLVINLLQTREDLDIELSHEGRSHRLRVPGSGRPEQRWDPIQNTLEWLKTIEPVRRLELAEQLADHGPGGEALQVVMNPEEIRRFAATDGATIGSHTHGHDLLDCVDIEQVRESLVTAESHLVRITGQVPRHLSYPNGNYSREVMDLVRELGFITAVTVKHGVWTGANNVLEIPRLCIGRFDTKAQFKATIAGFL